MRTEAVTCDLCERDLTRTTNCEGYRLVMDNECIPPWGGAVTAMHIEPPLDRTHHFCGVACLVKWAKVRYGD